MRDWGNDPSGQNWRRFEQMARKGFGRFATGLGDFNFLDHGFKISRMLASGDLRLVALYFIEQQPRHGYDLIKAIEEKSHGMYSPSPGVVYPALTFLEEAGYITAEQDGNKKSYTITDAGRAYLADNRQAIESTLNFLAMAGERMRTMREKFNENAGDFRPGPGGWGRGGDFRQNFRGGPDQPQADRDIPNVLPEVNDARRALKSAISETLQDGDDDRQRRLAEILRRAAQEIAGLRNEQQPGDIDL